MQRLGDSPRHVAAQIALQLYGAVDPDTSKYLADHVIFAIDRAAWRGHTDSGPTHEEVNRAASSFERQGIAVSNEQMYGALLAALCPGLVGERVA